MEAHTRASECPGCGHRLCLDYNLLCWRCTNPACERIYKYEELPGISLTSGNETKQGKEQHHWEAETGSYGLRKPDAYREFRPRHASSWGHPTDYRPPKKPRRAPKVIGITLACMIAIAVLIAAVNHFVPRLSITPRNLSFAVADGLNPATETLEIASNRRAITWSASDDAEWLNLDPADGSTGYETPMNLSVNIAGMYPGEYTATISIYAPDAANKVSGIPVSLVILETKETLAIRQAVGGSAGDLVIHYGRQPPYSKGPEYSHINLINSQTATDPTWQQLMQFIASDDTDREAYVENIYMCGSFAETLHNRAEQRGIRAAWVAIDFMRDSEGHALNAFYTVDRGLVFVDCTGSEGEAGKYWWEEGYSSDSGYDKIAYVQLDKEYGRISSDVVRSPQYTFYEQYKQRRKEYERRLEAYNRRVQEYNQEISGKVYTIGSSEYYRITRIRNELEQELRELGQLEQELGSTYWEPLGVVSRVEIYW